MVSCCYSFLVLSVLLPLLILLLLQLDLQQHASCGRSSHANNKVEVTSSFVVVVATAAATTTAYDVALC